MRETKGATRIHWNIIKEEGDAKVLRGSKLAFKVGGLKQIVREAHSYLRVGKVNSNSVLIARKINEGINLTGKNNLSSKRKKKKEKPKIY